MKGISQIRGKLCQRGFDAESSQDLRASGDAPHDFGKNGTASSPSDKLRMLDRCYLGYFVRSASVLCRAPAADDSSEAADNIKRQTHLGGAPLLLLRRGIAIEAPVTFR